MCESSINTNLEITIIITDSSLTLSCILIFSWPLFRFGARRTLLVSGGSIMTAGFRSAASSSGSHLGSGRSDLIPAHSLQQTKRRFAFLKFHVGCSFREWRKIRWSRTWLLTARHGARKNENESPLDYNRRDKLLLSSRYF